MEMAVGYDDALRARLGLPPLLTLVPSLGIDDAGFGFRF